MRTGKFGKHNVRVLSTNEKKAEPIRHFTYVGAHRTDNGFMEVNERVKSTETLFEVDKRGLINEKEM